MKTKKRQDRITGAREVWVCRVRPFGVYHLRLLGAIGREKTFCGRALRWNLRPFNVKMKGGICRQCLKKLGL